MKAPRVRRRLRSYTFRAQLGETGDVDGLIRSERAVVTLERRRLQNLRWVEKVTRAPHHVVRGRRDRDVVVIEVAVELLQVGEIHLVPAIVVVEHGDARIEVGEEPGGGI